MQRAGAKPAQQQQKPNAPQQGQPQQQAQQQGQKVGA
jgi:hypothetical protein